MQPGCAGDPPKKPGTYQAEISTGHQLASWPNSTPEEYVTWGGSDRLTWGGLLTRACNDRPM
ncbi:hypothetical protein EBZ38_16210 [bacterium]|nr:hypothetical protein [bacterium]